jgi:trans-2,3-dihydro-3-hydroxyanthranilate isomerase
MTDAASLEFHTVDVFTDRAFGGNPLAVVLDSQGLPAGIMQAITREFNYSETIFLSPPGQAGHDARARIFTPGGEIPFAGHPNIGAGFIAARLGALFGRPVGDSVIFEEAAGLVEIENLRDRAAVTGGRLTAPQPLRTGAEVSPEIAAACAGLTAADIRGVPMIASVGLPFVIAELAADRAVIAAKPSPDAFARHMPVHGCQMLLLFHRDGADLHARMFSPLDGVMEDPATGSAGAALAALLAARDAEPEGLFEFTIGQGAEMGRPSRLLADAEKRGGGVVRVRIGGSCVPVMTGRLRLPAS